jgi:prepilin-type processing-associated H-X9-DG protein
LRLILLGLVLLAATGLVLPLILQSRANRDRIACQNHLRELGLFAVRNAGPPGHGLPTRPRDELPPGTFQNPDLSADRRMSWYAYTLNALIEGPPTADTTIKHRRPSGLGDSLTKFDAAGTWDSERNAPLANYRLATALCPAQVGEYPPGDPVPTNYIAVGGLGLDTPAKSLDQAGPLAGAYRYDGATPDAAIKDGLQQTAQIVETNTDVGPWLRGGPSTLRGLDAAATPYLGPGRPFGGCHPGGANVSFADGSVRFVKETIDPAVFRAMFTIAGGPAESNFDGP